MKKVMKFGLVMAALLAMAVTTFANTTDFAVRVNATMGKTISFSVMNTPEVHLSLTSNGETLFEENATGTGLIQRRYDLTSFPAGAYELQAESNDKVLIYDVTVSEKGATVSEKPVLAISKPMIVKKDAKVSLSIINPSESAISIALFDSANNELFTEETTHGKISHIKMFDFSTAPQDEYTFITRYGNRTFINRVVAGK